MVSLRLVHADDFNVGPLATKLEHNHVERGNTWKYPRCAHVSHQWLSFSSAYLKSKAVLKLATEAKKTWAFDHIVAMANRPLKGLM